MTRNDQIQEVRVIGQISQMNWFVGANELVEYFRNTSIATTACQLNESDHLEFYRSKLGKMLRQISAVH